MPINSKAKGSGFELKVAKLLSEWSGHKFMRTPMSGAIHNFKDKRVVSDIVAPLSIGEWPFSIECKKVEYDYDFTFILKGSSMFWDHWKQACSDADREGLFPMLVFSKNYRDTYVALPVDIFVLLYCKKPKPSHVSVYYSSDTRFHELVIFSFSDFLATTSLNEVIGLKNL